MTKYMKTITSTMPRMTMTTQGMAPCGACTPLGLTFAGLNFAIPAMVSPRPR
jgi:hypothetical protein